MIKKLRLWLLRVWRWYRHRALYVIADPRDSSITLSKTLFEVMEVMDKEQAQVLVFTVGSGTADVQYAFAINPDIKQPTQLCDIQYNTKLHTIGFETLCPTVARIFYDYGLGTDSPVKLSVDINEFPVGVGADETPTATHLTYYTILRPHDKHHQ